jgi:glutamate racemase
VQSDFVAPSLEDYLKRHPEIESQLTRNGSERFLTTDHTEGFDQLARIFLGKEIASENVELGAAE